MINITVKVGNIYIGKGLPIVVQSMCNTATCDIESSLNQCRELHKAGAQIIRLTTQGMKEVEALREISRRLKEEGINTPLVADVHFTSDVAIAVASFVEKVRINPGNFAKDFDEAKSKFAELIKVCKTNNTAIRIGVNHGSLGERIIEKYGDTPLGMKEAAYEWIKMAEENDFNQIVVSLKASNTKVMTEAYRLLYNQMVSDGKIYPLHLGVTEAGNGDSGRIKSAVGLSTLLKDGIGETIRVSLTESPVNEIPVAKYIANYFKFNSPNKVDNHFLFEEKIWDEFILSAACRIGPFLMDNKIEDFTIEHKESALFTQEQISFLKDEILQAARKKFTKPEYIACPGCGRTLFNLEDTFEEVKRRTSHLVGFNIAVMGCIVNGPGEMADADYGYVGEGRGKVCIYRGKTPVYRSVPQDQAIDKLLELIEEDIRNKVARPRNV